jgi:hypothetical protein
VIYVPSGGITTIQAAIDAASVGTAIIVAPGVYFENISFRGQDVVLRSTAPLNPSIVAQTVIDGGGDDSVITFAGPETAACVIEGFTIKNGAAKFGAGILGFGCLATIQNNVIVDNESNQNDGLGGGLAACNGLIQNNVIAFNRTTGLKSDGGGLYFCNGTIRNNTVYGNSTQHATSKGGGLANCSGSIRNNIVYANTANKAADAQLYNSATPSYSCVQGGVAGGVGNIAGDPQLNNPLSRNFHLLAGSPCIDAGGFAGSVNIGGVILPQLTFDYDGTRRASAVRFPPSGDGSSYDIGADEYAGNAVGDFWRWYN